MTLADRWSKTLLPTYAVPPLTLVRGAGTTVWDDRGQSYLDLVAGIAVTALGHAHPAVVAAVTRQLSTLGHVSNLYVTEPAVQLAERLQGLLGAPDARVFFANSGAEAVEAAVKIARRWGSGERTRIVAAEGSFHGRTLGALAVTGQPAKRAPFEPLPGPVTFVPYDDETALAAAVDRQTAAVFLEPVLGEGGVRPASPGYLQAARRITSAAGALLVLDEVQTGIGRTGAWFAHTAAGVTPDVVTLAKALGGGLPIGACIALGPAAQTLEPGQHGSTFGGNPVCCAAALAVLDTIEQEALLDRVVPTGNRLVDLEGHPLLAGSRGIGLLRALLLTAPAAAAVEAAARGAGLLVNAIAPDVVRLAPPLVLTLGEVDRFRAALPSVLSQATEVVSVVG